MTWLTTLLPGLLLGIALQRIGFADLHSVRRTFALRTPGARALLAALGFGMILCALLCWLAVIDTDLLPVLPLDGGVLLGGIIAGIALGLTGCTPGTCLAALGGGRFLPALCGLLGVISGAAVFRLVGDKLIFADALLPASTATLFRVTLTQPYVVDGRFLGLGCLGLFIVAVTLLFRRDTPAEVAPDPVEESAPPPSTEPAVIQEEAFVSLLPEEEPLVVDTASEVIPPPAVDDAAPPNDDNPPEAATLPLPEESSMPDAAPENNHLLIADESAAPPDTPASDSIAPNKEAADMTDLLPTDPVTPGMAPAPASADPETGVSPVPVVLPARKMHKRKPTGTRKRR